MKKKMAETKETRDEISKVIIQLQEAEQRLQQLTGGGVDAVILHGGQSYLLHEAQEKLRQNEAAQSSILNALPAHIALLDREGVIVSVNESWRKFSGDNALQDTASAIGQNYLEICERAHDNHAKEANEVATGIRSVLSGKSDKFALEYPCHSPTEQRWFQLMVTPMNAGPGGAVVMHINITARKLAEESLRESEGRFHSMFTAAATGIAISTPDGHFLQANAAYCGMLGYSEQELQTRDFASLTYPDDLAHNLKLRDEMLAGLRESFVMEKRYLRKNGDIVWASTSISALRAPGKEISKLIVVAENITGRKLAEEALLKQQTELQALFDLVPAMLCIKDTENNFLRVNQRLAEAAGRPVAEIEGKLASEIFPRDAAKYYADDLEVIRSRRAKLGIVEQLQGADGKDLWVQTDKVPVSGKDGNVTGLIVMAQDITERRQAGESLRESEERFRSMFTAAATGIAISTTDGRFLQANPAYCRMLGYTEEELREKDFASLTHPEDLAVNLKLRDDLLNGLRDSFVMEKRYLKKGGRIVWVSHSVSPVRDAGGEIDKFIVVAENITERKKAEKSLLLFRTLIDQSNDIIEVIDPATYRYLDVNESACTIHGYTRKEMLSMSVGDIDPDFGSPLQEWIQRDLQTAGRMIFESRHRRKDGTIFPVEVTIRLVQLEKRYIVSIVRDITERKRTEARFRRLMDSNAQGVFFWNMKGEVTDANNFFLKLTGYTREEMEAGHIKWTAMTPPEYAELDRRALKEIAATGTCATYEKEFIRKDGTRVPILIGAATFEDNRDEGVAFVLDLTERRKLEQQFRQIQKMESIGQLAGGVAHDFNNVLAVIQMQAGALRLEEGISAAQREISLEIENAAQRAANITRQLLTFSRRQTVQLTELEMNEAIANMTRLLRRVIGEQVEMQFKFSMEPLFVHADAGMMDQVLMNLVVNARDAMPGGGRLIIETKGVQFGETVRDLSPQARAGSFVCIGVSDTGTGIPPEILPKIFEPFFTTKEVGKGTGLGLATVFGIVQQHQGWINVYSEAGKGTTFRVYLPRLGRKSDQKFVAETLDAGPGGKETILLVEDESHLRVSIKNILSRLGYNVLDAANGAEALEIWKKNRDKIDLVLTDMVMPGGISGRELGERLLKEDAGLKIIYASGYNTEIADRDFQLKLKEGVNYLSKPFDVQKLAKTVRDKLDEATS
jgi:PAS domain S-box-containing protein